LSLKHFCCAFSLQLVSPLFRSSVLELTRSKE
jgi:hypothetical protein